MLQPVFNKAAEILNEEEPVSVVRLNSSPIFHSLDFVYVYSMYDVHVCMMYMYV